jgi:hypothetical protein
MSLYKEGTYSVPGRIVALHELLVSRPRLRERRHVCESLLMPESLLETEKKRPMVRAVINEAIKLGLVGKEEDDIFVDKEVPKILRDTKGNRRYWPVGYMDLIASNEENQDLALALAWWLSLPVFSAPGDWTTINRDQKFSTQARHLGMNDVRYTMLAAWAVYLGFAWRHLKQTLVPDPTCHIRWRLEQEFGSAQQALGMTEFLRKLAVWCPVLDSGSFRLELEKQSLLEKLPAKHLSSALSFSLLRLTEEGRLDLSHAADAEALLLDEVVVADRPELQRVSQVRWLGKCEEPA